MPKTTASSLVPRRKGPSSFTLVEMLTVIGIIAILAALTIYAARGVMKSAYRSRASTEIYALGTQLEAYKTDNGIYPQASSLLTNAYASYDGTMTNYSSTSQILYQALSAQTYFTNNPVPGNRVYFSFKQYQVGTAAGGSYVQDPWGYSYAYSTGTAAGAATTNFPYNGGGFYDLWSTGGVLVGQLSSTPSLTNGWIESWQQQ